MLFARRLKLTDFGRRLISSDQLAYSEYGDPKKVLRMESRDLPDSLEGSEVLVKYMACPVNPADVNMIQGVYPIKPKLPAVGGNEGVAKIEKIGADVKSVRVGQWVLPAQAGKGTWRNFAIYPESEVMQISPDIPLTTAATLLVNPTTAYRILKDFQNLKPGDCIIQNGANSGVGRSAIQIAKGIIHKLRDTNWGIFTNDLISVMLIKLPPPNKLKPKIILQIIPEV